MKTLATQLAKLFLGTTTAYFVYAVTKEVSDDLVDEGSIANAFGIGAGRTALCVSAGVIAAGVLSK